MATVKTHAAYSQGEYEPYLDMQFLPRCANCHAPHPLTPRNFAAKWKEAGAFMLNRRAKVPYLAGEAWLRQKAIGGTLEENILFLAREMLDLAKECPGCGTATPKLPSEIRVGADLHAPFFTAALVNALWWAGRKLRALAKRIEP